MIIIRAQIFILFDFLLAYRLRDDIKMQADQLISQQTRLRDALNTISEIQSQQLPLQYDVTKITCENDILNSRVAWSEKELEDRTSEFLALKREMSDKIFSLKSDISSTTLEKSRLLDSQRSLEVRFLTFKFVIIIFLLGFLIGCNTFCTMPCLFYRIKCFSKQKK